MKIKFQKFFPYILLLLVVVLFFLPFLNGKHVPYAGDFTGSDLTELNFASRYYASESLKSGQAPLWTNLLANGFPLLAEGQAGVFYPFNLILFVLLPFVWAINLTFLLNFYLAGVFTYLYARIIKISTYGSVLAALVFSFSGFFIFRIKHLNLVNAAIWLPLQLYLIERYLIAKNKKLVLIALSFVFAIQFLAGHPQISYISVLISFLYFVFRILSKEKFNIRQSFIKIIIPWIFVGALSLGISAIQLLPTLSYSSLSARGLKMSYQQVVDFAFHLPSLLTFINPYAFGNPALATYPLNVREFGIFWENNLYLGFLGLLLALIGMIFISWKKSVGKSLLAITVISWIFILGDKTFLFSSLWEAIPGFKVFRFPQRFLLASFFCLAVFAGFGFDNVWEKIKYFINKRKKEIKSKVLFNHLLPLVIIFIVAIDLFIVGFKYVGILDFNKFVSPPKTVEILKEDKDNFRIVNMKWPDAWHGVYLLAGGWQNNLDLYISEQELIPPNLNIFWDIASAQDRGYFEGGLLNQEMQNVIGISDKAIWRDPNENGSISLPQSSLKLLAIQNVKYILSYDILESDNLILIDEVKKDFLPTVKIYQNEFYQDFAYGVFDVKISNSAQEDFDIVLSDDFDPGKSIALRQDVLNIGNSTATSTVVVNSMKDGKLDLNVNFSKKGYLYISQNFIPGWQAFIDGNPAAIIPANHAFTAIAVPAGEHEVYLEYKPLSYSLGKLITLLTVLLTLVLAYFFKITNGYQRRT